MIRVLGKYVSIRSYQIENIGIPDQSLKQIFTYPILSDIEY